jgi:hypothetical protein
MRESSANVRSTVRRNTNVVIPAQTGIHFDVIEWILACAGMTPVQCRQAMHTRFPDTRRTLAAIVGCAVIAAALWLLVSALLVVYAYAQLAAGKASDSRPVLEVQRALYFGGLRKQWQHQPDCVDFDETLIYVPRPGACRLSNVEFDTVLNFTREGRHVRQPDAAACKPILVLGDSHAMGWGVQDRETYSQVLADLTRRPVFNLGVSSYGTARELARAVESDHFAEADTIIIQYCDNDLDENASFRVADRAGAEAKFRKLLARGEKDWFAPVPLVWSALRAAMAVTLGAVSRSPAAPATQSFAPHYPPFMERLAAYSEALKDKTVWVFYVNGHYPPFAQYPSGASAAFANVRFFDAALTPADFYAIDDHMTPAGHRKVGAVLARLIGTSPE